MNKLLILLIFCPFFLFGQIEYSTSYNYGGNAVFPTAEQVNFGISTKADAIAWYNKVQGDDWKLGIGAGIGYFSYYNEGVNRTNTLGMSFNVSDEYNWQVGLYADYGWSLGWVYGINVEVTAYKGFIHDNFDLIVGFRGQRLLGQAVNGVTPFLGFRHNINYMNQTVNQ